MWDSSAIRQLIAAKASTEEWGEVIGNLNEATAQQNGRGPSVTGSGGLTHYRTRSEGPATTANTRQLSTASGSRKEKTQRQEKRG